MVNLKINGVKATVLIESDNEEALQQVALLKNGLGFNAQKKEGTYKVFPIFKITFSFNEQPQN
jgi:hypothetical protein